MCVILLVGFMNSVSKLCGNCSRARFNLTGEEVAFILNMYARFGRETIQRSFIIEGQVHGGRGRIDKDQMRFVQLSRRRRWCWKERCLVAATDQACYAWKWSLNTSVGFRKS